MHKFVKKLPKKDVLKPKNCENRKRLHKKNFFKSIFLVWKKEKEMRSPGFEPGSRAWEARILPLSASNVRMP